MLVKLIRNSNKSEGGGQARGQQELEIVPLPSPEIKIHVRDILSMYGGIFLLGPFTPCGGHFFCYGGFSCAFPLLQ